MFAKALKGQDIEELLSNIASAPVGGAAISAPVGDAAPAKVEKGKIRIPLSTIVYPYITK